MIRRLLIVTVLAALGSAAGLAPIAAADRPTKEPLPGSDFSGQFCADFPVLVHVVSDKEFLLTFSGGERAMFAGQAKLELTNLDTGKSITVNASGPGTFSFDEGTLTFRGSTLLAGEAGFFGPSPRLTLSGGQIVLDLATNAILSETGQSTDLCAVLADP